MAEEKSPFLNKSVSIGQALAIAITVFSAVLTFYTQTQIRLKEVEVRINIQETKSNEFDKKIDKIIDGQNEIKVLLQNKVDRSNN